MRPQTSARRALAWVPLAIASLTIAGLSPIAAAQGHGPGGGQRGSGLEHGAPGSPEGPPPRMERLLDRLDLTDEQREEIEKLHEEAMGIQRSLHKELQRAEHDLKGELLEDDPSIDRVRELAERAGAIRTRVQVHRLEQRLAIQKILTAEQRERLEMMRNRAEWRTHDRSPRHDGRRGGRRDHHGGRRPGRERVH